MFQQLLSLIFLFYFILDIPALVSYPHLLHTSPLYQSLVDGLKPNKTLHETFFDIEPVSYIINFFYFNLSLQLANIKFLLSDHWSSSKGI